MSQAPPAGWGRACQRWSLYRVVPQPLVPQGMASMAGLPGSRAWVKVGTAVVLQGAQEGIDARAIGGGGQLAAPIAIQVVALGAASKFRR